MAESVDALVSNTSECKFMPVRARLWVLKKVRKKQKKSKVKLYITYIFECLAIDALFFVVIIKKHSICQYF